MPYALPRGRELQDAYNEQLRQAYESTRRVARSGRDLLACKNHGTGAIGSD
jgi:hypothetical protein